MPHTLRMPEVAANATHATLVCWNKSEGQRIEVGESIADVETDKAVLELPVEKSGVVGKLLVKNGAEVPVGDPIAILLQDGESFDEIDADHLGQNEQSLIERTAIPNSSIVSELAGQDRAELVVANQSYERVFSSPVARKLARENDINLSNVVGSGPNGRVTKHDVVSHLESLRDVSAGAPLTPASGQVAARVVAPTATRRTIARRLAQSKSDVPHFYLRARCEVDALLDAREQINQSRDVPISINDFIVRAVAVALQQVPEMNVSWRDDGIHHFEQVDISVAVDTPNGLYTPIVRDAGNKTLSVISAEIRQLVGLAREGRLQASQFQGGTFSVSNLGMFGVNDFDAIINPPQAGILAVGTVQVVPVVRSDSVVPGRVVDLVLSVDHRVVDGAVGARWLVALKVLLEQPLRMLV